MKKHSTFAGPALALLVLMATGCSTPRTGGEVDILMDYAMRSSTERMAQGNALESLQMARAVAEIDPKYPGVQKALVGMPADLEHLFDRKILGSNVAIRQPIDASWYAHVLWYIPDRLLDALDTFSFDVHLGIGLWVDAHATRAIQVGLGGRTVAGVGWHTNRSLGLQTQSQAGVNLLAFGTEGYSAMHAGTSGVRAGSWSEAGLHNPSSTIYQDYKDYWAVGGSVTALFVGADADVHLIQVYDFLVGWLLFDPLNDDFASTTGVALSTRERQLMRSLGEIASSKEEIEAYFVWKGMQEREAKEKAAADAPAPPADDTPAEEPGADPADEAPNDPPATDPQVSDPPVEDPEAGDDTPDDSDDG